MKILAIATPSLPTFAGIASPNVKGSYQGLRLPVAVLALVPDTNGKGGDTRVVPLVYLDGEFVIATDNPGFLGLEVMMTPNQAAVDWGRKAQEYAANKKKQEAIPAAPQTPPPASGSSAGDPNAGKGTTTSQGQSTQ